MKYFLLFLTSIILNNSYSQTNMEDVVYLKNGSVIRGMITEMIPNQSVKIKSDRNVFVYKMDEIEKMTKEETNDVLKTVAPEVYDINLFKSYLSDRVRNETNGLMSLVSLNKMDGTQIKLNDGTEGYKLFFNFSLKTEADIYSPKRTNNWGNSFQGPFGIHFNGIAGFDGDNMNKFMVSTDSKFSNYFLSKGAVIIYKSEAILIKTERNWTVKFIEIKSFQIISNSEIQENESIKKQKQTQEQFEQKKEEFKKSNFSESNPIYKVWNFKADHHPIHKDYSIQLSNVKLLDKNMNFDFEAIQNAFLYGMTSHARISSNYSNTDSPRVKLIFEVKNIKSKFSSGTKLLSKEAYSGYEVSGDFRLRVFTQGTEIITDDWSLKGGNPYSNHSEQIAFDELLKNIIGSTNSIIYSLFTFSSKINAVTKENDKEVKRVYLSNAELVPDKYLMYFVIVEKNDYTILPSGKEDVKNIIATLEKKSIEDGQIDCKVTSGGTKLKELFKSGKEYLVLSSRAKPQEVD